MAPPARTSSSAPAAAPAPVVGDNNSNPFETTSDDKKTKNTVNWRCPLAVLCLLLLLAIGGWVWVAVDWSQDAPPANKEVATNATSPVASPPTMHDSSDDHDDDDEHDHTTSTTIMPTSNTLLRGSPAPAPAPVAVAPVDPSNVTEEPPIDDTDDADEDEDVVGEDVGTPDETPATLPPAMNETETETDTETPPPEEEETPVPDEMPDCTPGLPCITGLVLINAETDKVLKNVRLLCVCEEKKRESDEC
jgi:hypothetical protein